MMLTGSDEFKVIAEVNPPQLPDFSHRRLGWSHVLVTDNVFGTIRVSPYAFAARITHDVPSVKPTVVVSTRDRNMLAIESEVRGAIGNGVESFLVVRGDHWANVDHMAETTKVVEHLLNLRSYLDNAFEVGVPSRFAPESYSHWAGSGVQFMVTGPALDTDGVEKVMDALDRKKDDPPTYLMVVPPFSLDWIERMEEIGAFPAGEVTREIAREHCRSCAWQEVKFMRERAEVVGFSGMIVVGMSFETMVDEAMRSLGISPTAEAYRLIEQGYLEQGD